MTIGRNLSEIRLPLVASFGGLPADFISGINWHSVVDNWVMFDTGVAVCPYPGGNRIVTVAAPTGLQIPTQPAGTTRMHMWLHDDDNDGVGTIVADNPPGFTNYFGNAFTNPDHPGWRYLGTCLLGVGRNPLRQRMANNEVRFMTNIAGLPCEIFNGNTSTTATQQVINGVAPPTATTHVIINTGGTGDAITRFASSPESCGFTVSGAVYSSAARPLTGELLLPLGNDGVFQFVSDTAGQNLAIRVIGYRFKR